MLGLSSEEFWSMTPRSYAAIQKAYTRLHYGEAASEEEKAEVEARRMHAEFTVMAAKQQARKAAAGDG
jgi:hypothetical protein